MRSVPVSTKITIQKCLLNPRMVDCLHLDMSLQQSKAPESGHHFHTCCEFQGGLRRARRAPSAARPVAGGQAPGRPARSFVLRRFSVVALRPQCSRIKSLVHGLAFLGHCIYSPVLFTLQLTNSIIYTSLTPIRLPLRPPVCAPAAPIAGRANRERRDWFRTAFKSTDM